MITTYDRGKGIVAGMRSDAPTRQMFFPITPDIVEMLEEHGAQSFVPPRTHIEFQVQDYLKLLPELEAEILYMLAIKGKAQKDVAVLLGMSQPTISYRYRRALDKLSYLMLLDAVDLKVLIAAIPDLREQERLVLYELFYTANQERTGAKYGVRQSSVKWIFTKAKRYLYGFEQKNPEQWAPHYALFILLEKNLRKRIFT